MRSSFRTFVIATTAVLFGFSSAAMAVTKKRPFESEFPPDRCIPEWSLDTLDPQARAFVLLGRRAFCNKAVPTGLSISGSGGYASTASNFSVFNLASAGTRDEVTPSLATPIGVTPNLVTPTGRAGFGGFSVALTSPNLFAVPGAQGRYQQGGFHLGVEAGMDFLSGSASTIQGLPGSSVPTATGSDTISIKPTNLTHVDGVLHIPVGWPGSPEWWALFDVFGKAGVGWVHSDVTYNCVGFCRFTPTVPAFSATQSTTQAGLYWGVGFGTPLPVKGFRGPPPILSFEFDQVSTGSKNIFLGTPATRQVGANVGPEHINMFRASITQAIDFGAAPWGGWGQGLVAR